MKAKVVTVDGIHHKYANISEYDTMDGLLRFTFESGEIYMIPNHRIVSISISPD